MGYNLLESSRLKITHNPKPHLIGHNTFGHDELNVPTCCTIVPIADMVEYRPHCVLVCFVAARYTKQPNSSLVTYDSYS